MVTLLKFLSVSVLIIALISAILSIAGCILVSKWYCLGLAFWSAISWYSFKSFQLSRAKPIVVPAPPASKALVSHDAQNSTSGSTVNSEENGELSRAYVVESEDKS